MTVTIRPLELEDAAAVQRYASDERVARTTMIPWPYPTDGGKAFVAHCIEERNKQQSFSFAIIADNEMVGVVGINGVDHEKRTAQCDYAIVSSHWNNGITTKAVSLALEYAFHDLELETINSACLVRNPGSGRVLEKNGFTEAGQFIYTSTKFKNEPAHRFQLTKQDWMEKNSGRAV